MNGIGPELWVHHVVIPSHLCVGLNHHDQRCFCRQLKASVQVHSFVYHQVSYRVFSFSNAQAAEYFRDCFDGERYDGTVAGGGRWLDEFSQTCDAGHI